MFNFTNFWDGRANNWFNGENPFGQQDQRARIFKSQGASVVVETVKMENASLASQAVGPPLSHFEMSFGNGGDNFRIMPLIGRKVFGRHVLQSQYVHPEDSLLGSLTDGKGQIHVTYEELIKRAFKSMYWDSETCVSMPDPELYRAKGNQFAVSNGQAALRPGRLHGERGKLRLLLRRVGHVVRGDARLRRQPVRPVDAG